MSEHTSDVPLPDNLDEEPVTEQDTLEAGEFAEPDEDPALLNDDVDEWPDPEGWAFYLPAPDEALPGLPDPELRYPELDTPF